MSPNVHFCPIKRFVADMEYEDMTEDIAAVFATSYDMDIYPNLEKYICIGFDDITDKRDPSAFTPVIAERIKSFVLSLEGVSDLFFCCDMGQSRSAALACAFMRYYGYDEMQVWSDADCHPNMLVYSVMCEALDLPCDDEMQEYLSKINKEALTDKIRKARL